MLTGMASLVALLLLLCAPPAQALGNGQPAPGLAVEEKAWDEATQGVKPEVAFARAIKHLLEHEAGQPLMPHDPDYPFNDAAAERVMLARAAIRAVEAGCVAPCVDPVSIGIYAGKIDFIAERLRMSPGQHQAAKVRYLKDGKPRVRPADSTYAPDNLATVVDKRVIDSLLKDRQFATESRRTLTDRSKQMADALGKTLEPGGFAATGRTSEKRRVETGGSDLTVFADPDAASPAADPEIYEMKEVDERLENAIIRAQKEFTRQPKMQQAIRALWTAADMELKRGHKPEEGALKGLFPMDSYERQLSLLAWHEMKGYRGDYGWGDTASAAMPGTIAFAEKTGIDLNNEQMAALDHFTLATSLASGPAGKAICFGMSYAWDSLLPLGLYAAQVLQGNTGTSGLLYNYRQLDTDAAGCRHGGATP